MSLRVIAGTAKGIRLKSVPGDSTRPIMDRVKEALFNIIGNEIIDARFLDLFAGTGSVGIEALSRGAEQAVFLDLDRRAIRTIHANLAQTRLAERAVVRQVDAFAFLERPPQPAFDYLYIAPPQFKGLWFKALQGLDRHPAWLPTNARAIAQIAPSELDDIAGWQPRHVIETDRRRYGNTLLLFYESAPDSDPNT